MLGYKLDYIWNHVTDTPNDRKTKNNPTFLLKMFKTFSTVFKLMLVSMFSCYFGHGDSSMYRYKNVQQSRPYTVVSCSLTHLSSLSQCAAVAGRSKSVTFFFHTDLGPDGYLCRWDCIFMNSYASSELCTLPCNAFGKII